MSCAESSRCWLIITATPQPSPAADLIAVTRPTSRPWLHILLVQVVPHRSHSLYSLMESPEIDFSKSKAAGDNLARRIFTYFFPWLLNTRYLWQFKHAKAQKPANKTRIRPLSKTRSHNSPFSPGCASCCWQKPSTRSHSSILKVHFCLTTSIWSSFRFQNCFETCFQTCYNHLIIDNPIILNNLKETR